MSILGWGLLAALVVLGWPAVLGGPTSYIIVTGNSMEPTLYPGDFVVLRTGEYEIGDVVSYTAFDDVPAQVIHTIIGFRDDGTVILQGDNNDFVDPYSPELSDITGKLVFSISKVGSGAWVLSQPIVWLSLVLIALALFLYHTKTRKSTRDRKEIPEQEGGTEE